MIDELIYLDFRVWYYLNVVGHNAFLDAVVPYLRNQWTWAPLYLFLLLFMTGNFKRKGWMWCVFFLLTFALSDHISAAILKPIFQRVRPCNNPYLEGIVHNIVPCGGGYSFPSSHAANHFSLAIFSAVSLQHIVKRIWIVALAWAILVSYAQVYVGVHFPLDVFCGGILGAIIGCLTGLLYNRIYKLNYPQRARPLDDKKDSSSLTEVS